MYEIDGARWVAPENIHLTLKFLGATPDDKLDEIEAAVEKAVSGFRKFYFSLDELGAFPSAKRARVIWVGIHHGANELIELSKAIENAMAPLGFEPENKAFKPHITLARIKNPKPIEAALSKVPAEGFSGRVINVDGVVIFESHLKRTGAEYEPARFIPLPG